MGLNCVSVNEDYYNDNEAVWVVCCPHTNSMDVGTYHLNQYLDIKTSLISVSDHMGP